MGDQEKEEGKGKKEPAVLSDVSLKNLASDLSEVGLVTAMYLNIPTTTLVHMRLAAGLKNENVDNQVNDYLQYWKRMRETAKDKDKVRDLERALREAGKLDVADVFAERARDDMELTADCFPSPS